ncbi:hypothetical protein C0416_04315 [bacterium]|nr:hypothetical protein [bacterium]
MKNQKQIKIGILMAIFALTTSVLWSASMLYASSAVNPYDNEKLTVQEVEKAYHKRVNEIFNAKLTLLKKGEKGNGTTEVPKNDECGETNYSTYCLAKTVAKEYDQYSFALSKRKAYVTITDKTITLEQAALMTISQNNEIINELDRSRKALDMAVKTYDELLAAYKMHLQYEKIIKSLTKYNTKLTEFRKEVEKLPGKFIDATTTNCT